MMDLNKTYLGTVEDINDPLKIGRCRVRVGFLFGDDISTENLPWAYPAYNISFGKDGNCGSVSIPKVGAIVRIKFDNGDLYSPIYDSMLELSSDVKSFLQKDYAGTHILLYDGDPEMKVYYITSFGFRIILKNSSISISNDGIVTLESMNGASQIEMDSGVITVNADDAIRSTAVSQIRNDANRIDIYGKQATYIGTSPNVNYEPAVLGRSLFELLSQMAAAIDIKTPCTPGTTVSLVESLKKQILSDSVNISK